MICKSATDLAPVVFFCYKRLDETQRAIESLAANYLAKQTSIYIFSDGPKSSSDEDKVVQVRKYIRQISGFKNVLVEEAESNKGLAASVIQGVDKVLVKYNKVIVLEDDLITSPNFLDFMNQALNAYQDNTNVLSVSGFSLSLPGLSKRYEEGIDAYLGYRASSWGWGTWADRWRDVDWDITYNSEFPLSPGLRRRLELGGSDLVKMLSNQLTGRIDSWAVRFCYHQAKRNQTTVFPTRSKVVSIGFDANATHTTNGWRFRTSLDAGGQRDFSFHTADQVEDKLAREFRGKFSIPVRIIDKALRAYSKKFGP
ncbi:glycosyltransferase [Pseudohongiella sp. O18]|uniref:glycosyltransferase n=1 Tax=Pseudohongiella sp. O18 TaxID=2904248 RepID=UPI001F440236|nr:glycosyltransferase [Pseudohongiella sp. O18]